MANNVYCAIKFAGELIDTGTILGVSRIDYEEYIALFLFITDHKPFLETYKDKNAAAERYRELVKSFGKFSSI